MPRSMIARGGDVVPQRLALSLLRGIPERLLKVKRKQRWSFYLAHSSVSQYYEARLPWSRNTMSSTAIATWITSCGPRTAPNVTWTPLKSRTNAPSAARRDFVENAVSWACSPSASPDGESRIGQEIGAADAFATAATLST